MSFSKEDIAGMLNEYETDYRTGMDVETVPDTLNQYRMSDNYRMEDKGE